MRRYLISLHVPTLVIAATLNSEQQQQQHRYDGGSFELDPQGFTLRHIVDTSLAHAILAKRDGNCGDGKHNCLDIQYPDRCCANDSYCYISKDKQPKCCPIGSNCVDDSYCSSQAYYCISTQTISATIQSPVAGCCDRACPQTSYYLCPQSLGGNCCPFGSNCQYGGNCVSTETTEATPRMTSAGEICTTGQSVCAGGGSGCCSSRTDGQPPPPTAPVPTSNGQDNTGSTSTPAGDAAGGGSSNSSGPSGATIGIAVGVSLGGAFILGCLAWLFLLKRKRDRQTQELEKHQQEQDQDQQQQSPPGCDPSMTTSSPSAQGLWSPPPPPSQVPTPSDNPYPILHEPNGAGAAPVEIDSVERVEVANTEMDRLSPRSFQVSDMESSSERGLSPETAGAARMTSWLHLSPVSPSSPDDS